MTFQEAQKDALRNLPAGWMMKMFARVVQEEAHETWGLLKLKNNKKKYHLEKRHRPRKEEGRFRGIPIGDVELGDDKDDVVCLAYGVELNEEEKEYMKLPNSMTDYVKLDEEKLKTEIQTMASKLSMSVREKEENKVEGWENASPRVEGENASPRVEREEEEERDEEAKMESKRVYNEVGKIADYRKRKVTDTNLNKRITVRKTCHDWTIASEENVLSNQNMRFRISPIQPIQPIRALLLA